MLDVIFLTKNRLEFTKASFETLCRNTNWSLVSRLLLFDDGSTDGTYEYLTQQFHTFPLPQKVRLVLQTHRNFGSPAAVTMHYVARHEPAPLFVKIDNDVIVPPGWLDRVVSVMTMHNDLHLLGIEPPKSRVPHFESGTRSPQPEHDPRYAAQSYAPCNSIGGIGAMRTEVFCKYGSDLRPHSIYGGFTEWQVNHREINKGWINPPLDLFLLDRMPTEPWASYSKKYIQQGNQRAWSVYPVSDPFWKWWEAPSVTA